MRRGHWRAASVARPSRAMTRRSNLPSVPLEARTVFIGAGAAAVPASD